MKKQVSPVVFVASLVAVIVLVAAFFWRGIAARENPGGSVTKEQLDAGLIEALRKNPPPGVQPGPAAGLPTPAGPSPAGAAPAGR